LSPPVDVSISKAELVNHIFQTANLPGFHLTSGLITDLLNTPE